MTEFDFDELDKAVSSLMKQTPAEDTDAVKPASVTKRSDFTNASMTDTSPESVEVVSVLELSPAEDVSVTSSPVSEDFSRAKDLDTARNASYSTPYTREDNTADLPGATVMSTASTTPAMNRNNSRDIVTKRRGTFMDVVHPSSDMRSKQKTSPQKLVFRQETIIAPPTSESTTSFEEKTDVELSPRPLTVTARVVNDRELVDTLNESIERESTKPETEPVTDFGYTLAPESKQDDEFDSSVIEPVNLKPSNISQINESLFISDAKVDKRPLGAQLTEASTDAPNEVGIAEKTDSPLKAQLPDELSRKIMAVESEREVTATPSVTPAPHASRSQHYAPATQTKSPISATPRLKALNSNQSAPSKPSEVEEDHPAIYDPAYYKQEAKPKAAKKSGLWVVLGIIGLIVLGGAGGVLYYFYSTGSISF